MEPTHAPVDTATWGQQLASFTGSLERFRHWTRRFVYTPGIDFLATRAGAWWPVDLIASRQGNRALSGHPFQIWKLTVQPDRSACLAVHDGNERQVYVKTIHRTDFPLDEIEVWLIDGTLLLPSEY